MAKRDARLAALEADAPADEATRSRALAVVADVYGLTPAEASSLVAHGITDPAAFVRMVAALGVDVATATGEQWEAAVELLTLGMHLSDEGALLCACAKCALLRKARGKGGIK